MLDFVLTVFTTVNNVMLHELNFGNISSACAKKYQLFNCCNVLMSNSRKILRSNGGGLQTDGILRNCTSTLCLQHNAITLVLYNKSNDSCYSAISRIKSFWKLFSRYTSGVNFIWLSKMTCVYIHYVASIVLANSFFWPEYPFRTKYTDLCQGWPHYVATIQ